MKPYIIPILQTIFIGLLVGSFYAISTFGEQYTLRAEPYDPYSPIYGEYVLLKTPDLKTPLSITEYTVYFTLKNDEDGYAKIDKIRTKPFFGAIKGQNNGNEIYTEQIQQYYVQQGEGPKLELAEKLDLVIDVAPWGALRPVQLTPREQ